MHETLQVEKISPKKAQQYLNDNTTNRSLRSGVVDQYTKDMVDGKWTHCVAPIVFYDNGDVADGQHRLWAIIESNTTQQFFVMRGLPRDAGLNIDVGLPRTLLDNARISGVDTELSYEAIGTARACALGRRSRDRMSPAAQLAMLEPIREPVLWSVEHQPNGKFLRNSLVRAALARAYMHEGDKDRLAHFSHILTTGFADSVEDTGAIALRNFLLKEGAAVSGVDSGWIDTFVKAQNAIWNFMRGREMRRVRSVNHERYPMPKKLGRSK
jgi:hypothetical protein